MPLHDVDQRRQGDRLVQVLFSACTQLLVLLEGLFGRFAREDHERHVLERVFLLELLADQEAVHARQLDREQDQIGPAGHRAIDARVAIARDLNSRAERLQPFRTSPAKRIALEHRIR